MPAVTADRTIERTDKPLHITKRIGSTTYKVSVHFSRTSRETMGDIVFDTSEGVLREDYQERVAYQEIEWESRRAKDKKTPTLLGGEPIWTDIKKYGKERPASYGGKPMGLILQVAENFNFDKLPDAPPEMKKSYLGNGGFKERTQPNYTLFYEFNRVYLWGPEDPSDPAVYINVQNDI